MDCLQKRRFNTIIWSKRDELPQTTSIAELHQKKIILFGGIGKVWYFLSCFQEIKTINSDVYIVIGWTNWTQRSKKNGQNTSIVKV